MYQPNQPNLINNINSIMSKKNKYVKLKYSKPLVHEISANYSLKNLPFKLIASDQLRVVLANLIHSKVGSYFSVNDRYLKKKPFKHKNFRSLKYRFIKKTPKKRVNLKNPKKFSFFKWPTAPGWAFARFSRQCFKRNFIHYRGSIKWADVNISRKFYNFISKSSSNSNLSLFLNCHRYSRYGWYTKSARNLLISNYTTLTCFKLTNPLKSTVIFPGFLMSNPMFKGIFIKLTNRRRSRLKSNMGIKYKVRLIQKQIKIISLYSNNFKPYNVANNKVDWVNFKKYNIDYKDAINSHKNSRIYTYFKKRKKYHKNFKIKPKTYNSTSLIFKFILSISFFLNNRFKLNTRRPLFNSYIFNTTDLFTFSYNFLAIITQLSRAYKLEGPYLRSFIKDVFPNLSNKKKRLKFKLHDYKPRRNNPFIGINQSYQFNDLILTYGHRRTWDNFFFNSALTNEYINGIRMEMLRSFKLSFFKNKLISINQRGRRKFFFPNHKKFFPTNIIKQFVKRLMPRGLRSLYFWNAMHEFNSASKDFTIRNKPRSVKIYSLNHIFNKFKSKSYLNSRFTLFNWFFNHKFNISRYKFNFLVNTKGKKFNLFFKNSELPSRKANIWKTIYIKQNNRIQKKSFKTLFKKHRIYLRRFKLFSSIRIKKFFNWRNFSIVNGFIRNEFALLNSISPKNWHNQRFLNIFRRKILKFPFNRFNVSKSSKFRFPSFFLLSFTKNMLFNRFYFLNYLKPGKFYLKGKLKHELMDILICFFNQRKFYRKYKLNVFNSRKFDFNSSALASFLPAYKEINFRTNSVFILSNILNDQVWIKPDIKHQFKLVLSGLYRNF